MSEFEVSTEVTNNRTSVSLDNESDGVFINVVGRFIHEGCEYIEVEGYDSLFPAFIPVDKWEAYRAEIDKAVAIYRVLRNKQS